MAQPESRPAEAEAPVFPDYGDGQLERCAAELGELGFARLEGYLDPAEVMRTRALLLQQVEALRGATYPGYTEFRPEDEQVFNLQNKHKHFIDLLGAPALERLLMAKLNDPYYPAIAAEAPNYILGEYIARASGVALKLHIDAWMPAPGPDTWMMQVAIALDDRDEDNGCTTVVPGSHLSGAYSDRDYENPLPLPARAGDLLLWDSRLWHGARANRSGRQAWSLVATLQRWWVKPRFDITAALPAEIYAALEPQQRALLGFCARPPHDEFAGTNTRQGYDALPGSLET